YLRDSGEGSPRARVAQHFGAQVGVCIRGGIPPFGPGGDGSISAEFDLTFEKARGSTVVHYENDEVGGLSSDLKTDAAAFECDHGRRSPRPFEVLASTADHDSAAVAAAHNEGRLEN